MPSPPHPEIPLRRFNASTNRYPAKKVWPPDLASMDHKHQFRLERRYRRRSQIAWLQPRWIRRTKLIQYVLSLGVVAYGIFGIPWDVDPDGMLATMRRAAGFEGGISTPFDAKNAHKKIEDSLSKMRGSEWKREDR